MEKTEKHLERYANSGLRTLLIAERELPKRLYEEWSEKYRLAGL